jgi:transposase
MEYIGIDVHKNESRVCRLTEDGEIVEQRVATRRDRFAAVLGLRPRARILIEASTESEWVARCHKELGHEVIVADPNFAPMYATRSRRVKTDRRDAQALMDACRLGAYRGTHRTSEPQRRVRTLLTVRDNLVRTLVRQVQVVRALLRREGLRVRSGQVASFDNHLVEVDTPQWLRDILAPLRAVMDELNREMVVVERTIEQIVDGDPVVQRLCTAPGIGPVTAVAFVSTLDLVQRFEGAHQVQAYLGLVPSEFSSGERQQRGATTKTGNTRLRWLLVEAAWSVMRSRRMIEPTFGVRHRHGPATERHRAPAAHAFTSLGST